MDENGQWRNNVELVINCVILFFKFTLQVRLCRDKKSGNIYAMKKLKKSEMLTRGQVKNHSTCQTICIFNNFLDLDVFHLITPL